MRFLILGAALLTLGACGEQQAAQSACARSATHEVDFTNSAAPDVLTASSDGPSCDAAFVTLSFRSGDGAPLMIESAVFHDIRYGGAPPSTAEPTTSAEMDEFLAGWANVSELKAGSLPAWAPGAAAPDGSDAGFSYSSDLAQETYEMLRAGDGAMLCFAAGMESSACIVTDPATNTPLKLVTFGP